MRHQLDPNLFEGETVELSLNGGISFYHNEKWIREVLSDSGVFEFKLHSGRIVKLFIDDIQNSSGCIKAEVDGQKIKIVTLTEDSKNQSKAYESLFLALVFLFLFINNWFEGLPTNKSLKEHSGRVVSFVKEKHGRSIYDFVYIKNSQYKLKLLTPPGSLEVGDDIEVKVKYIQEVNAYEVYSLRVNGVTIISYSGSYLYYYVIELFGTFAVALLLFCWSYHRYQKYNKPLKRD